MSEKIGALFALALLLSYPVAAAGAGQTEDGWPISTKLASVLIEVDQAAGLAQAEVLNRADIPNKDITYGSTPDVTLDGNPLCPTCFNCAVTCAEGDLACDSPDVNEIMVISFQYRAPAPYDAKVRPTAGQDYGFELDNVQWSGSASSCTDETCTYEIICPQAAPSLGYEFGHKNHCAVVLSVAVDDCSSFGVFFDVMGTVG